MGICDIQAVTVWVLVLQHTFNHVNGPKFQIQTGWKLKFGESCPKHQNLVNWLFVLFNEFLKEHILSQWSWVLISFWNNPYWPWVTFLMSLHSVILLFHSKSIIVFAPPCFWFYQPPHVCDNVLLTWWTALPRYIIWKLFRKLSLSSSSRYTAAVASRANWHVFSKQC